MTETTRQNGGEGSPAEIQNREKNQEREKLATELLLDLVRIPSVTGTEHECEPVDTLVAFFEKYGKEHGIKCRIIEAGGKRNFIAEIGNDKDGPSVLLNAHFDVVSADAEMFNPRIKDGVLYGRGACDDKGGLAAMAVAMVEIAKTRNHKGKVIFCAVNGEEENTKYGTEECLEENIVAKHVIIAEPTNGSVVVGHAGIATFKVKVEGTSAHSSMPELGRNAIPRLTAVCRDLGRQLRMVHDPRWPKPPTLMPAGIQSVGFDNVVPDYAEVTFNIRPQENPENIFAQVNEILSKLKGTSFERKFSAKPCVFKEDSGLVLAALQATGQQKAICVPWRSEGVTYVNHPYSNKVLEGVVVYGPGNIEDAHTRKEQIQVADILKVAHEYQEIIRLCQNPDLIKK